MSTMRWSRHSRRMEPITRSAIAFAFGARTGVKTVVIPIAAALATKSPAVSPIAVADQEAGMRIPRRGRQDLPPHPRGVGMPGDVPVHNAAAIVADHEKDVEGLQGERLDGEEVPPPRCPARTGGGRSARRARGLVSHDSDTPWQHLPGGPRTRSSAAMRRTPHTGFSAASRKMSSRVVRSIGARPGPAPRLFPAPVPPPSQPVPTHDGGGLHDPQMGAPRGPPPRRDRPELPVPPVKSWAGVRIVPRPRAAGAGFQVLQDQIASSPTEDPDAAEKEPPVEPHALASAGRLLDGSDSLKADRVLKHHNTGATGTATANLRLPSMC